MNHLGKVCHTAQTTGQDPGFALSNHLMQYRATLHPSTRKPPAELLFGRQFRINLPDMRHNITGPRLDIQEASKQDNLAKVKMKKEKDSHRNVKETNIQQGDLVLLRSKSSKHESRYDPEAYLAVQVQGSQVVGERGRYQKPQDAQRWKRYEDNTWDLTECRGP